MILRGVLLAFLLLSGLWARAAEPRVRHVVTTNYVIVTNLVVVTNVVVEPGSIDPEGPKPPSIASAPLPVAPLHGDMDWVQLTSGEWLKGKIRALQDRKLEFDSDKLDDQTIDLKDVAQLYSPLAFCVYGDRETAFGKVHITGDVVSITGTREVVFRRKELLGLSPGAPKEINYWSAKFNLGVNLSTGNTEQVDMSTRATVQRRTPNTHLKLDYLGNFSWFEDDINVNNHRVTLTFDRFLTRRFFVRPIFGEYYRDPFQNIAHRGSVGLGGGYYLFDRPDTEWMVFGGPAYQYTRFDDVAPGEDTGNSTPAMFVGSRFEKDLTKRIDLSLQYQAIITSRASGLVNHHSASTLSIDITRRLDLDLSLVWDRTEEPAPGADGSIPKKNDFRLSLSLGLEF